MFEQKMLFLISAVNTPAAEAPENRYKEGKSLLEGAAEGSK